MFWLGRLPCLAVELRQCCCCIQPADNYATSSTTLFVVTCRAGRRPNELTVESECPSFKAGIEPGRVSLVSSRIILWLIVTSGEKKILPVAVEFRPPKFRQLDHVFPASDLLRRRSKTPSRAALGKLKFMAREFYKSQSLPLKWSWVLTKFAQHHHISHVNDLMTKKSVNSFCTITI